MDFSIEGNFAFEAGSYDSITSPVIHFNEMDDYPKQYVVTRNPMPDKKNPGPDYVIMDNAELKAFRSQRNNPIYSGRVRDYTSQYKPNKNTIAVESTKNDGIIRTSTEGFLNFFDRDDRMKWLLFSILIIFVSLVVQTVQLFTNNMILTRIINSKLENPNNE